MCNGEWVLKNSFSGEGTRLVFFRGCSFFGLVPTGELGGCSEGGTRGLAEEAHQSFDVLGSRRQEELLTNKLDSA